MSFVDSEDSESWCFEKNRRREVCGVERHQHGRQGKREWLELTVNLFDFIEAELVEEEEEVRLSTVKFIEVLSTREEAESRMLRSL